MDEEEEETDVIISITYEERCQASKGRERGNSLKRFGRRYDKSQVKCYNCQKYGHCTWECRSHTNNVEDKVNYTENEEAKSTLLLVITE
jgi:hypothetical protein